MPIDDSWLEKVVVSIHRCLTLGADTSLIPLILVGDSMQRLEDGKIVNMGVHYKIRDMSGSLSINVSSDVVM